MPVTVTNIGTATGASGATLAITLGAAIPAGQLIVVAVTEKSTSGTSGTLADTAGNTYSTAIGVNLAGTAANGRGTLFYAWNSKALANGNTITYTRNLSAASCAMSACWVSGIFNNADPRDSAVQNSATGTTGTITVTSATTIPTWDWILGVLFDSGTSTAGGNATFTQASGYATPPNEATTGGSGGSRVDGGNRRNTGAAASFTYNPTLSSTAQQWADVITAFKSIPDNFLAAKITDLVNPALAAPWRLDQTWTVNLLQTTLKPAPPVPDRFKIFRGILRSLPDQPPPANAFQSWAYNLTIPLSTKPPDHTKIFRGPLKSLPDQPLVLLQQSPFPNLVIQQVKAPPPGEQVTDRPQLPIPPALTWIQTVAYEEIAKPFAQYDWPNPIQPYKIDQTWSWSYNLNLIGQDKFNPGQQSTDLPPRDFPRLLQAWIQNTNLALLTAPPSLLNQVHQWDYPNPRGAEPDWRRSWEWSYNKNLIGQDRLPPRQQDWPLPQTPQQAIQTWILQSNIGLYARPDLTQIARQMDWPNPIAPQQPALGWAAWYNLNLIGQDRLPFRQMDWPLTPAAARGIELATWIDRVKWWLLKPFNQLDWPNPTPLARDPTLNGFAGRYLLELIGQDQLPNRQQDWLLSPAYAPTVLQTFAAGTPIRFLAPLKLPPGLGPASPGAAVYDRPQLRQGMPADFYTIGLGPFPPPAPPIVTGLPHDQLFINSSVGRMFGR